PGRRRRRSRVAPASGRTAAGVRRAAPPPDRPTTAATCGMDLRVLSYNIHRAIGVDRLFRPERVAAIIRYHEPDIVLLQEVDDGVPRSRGLNLATELATALGFEHYK